MTADATAGLARVNGIELAYQIHGRGRPLVLLHGGFGSVEMFGPNIAALAAGRQVIGVDLQSHGRTPAVDRPMLFETMADDVAALIGHLGHERADVMGFSLGGAVALRAAIQHPGSVRRLVLASTPCRRGGWYPEMIAAFDQMGPEIAEPMKQTPGGLAPTQGRSSGGSRRPCAASGGMRPVTTLLHDLDATRPAGRPAGLEMGLVVGDPGRVALTALDSC
jgi:pimeloyl-ACP methyl ester carboxylesterase